MVVVSGANHYVLRLNRLLSVCFVALISCSAAASQELPVSQSTQTAATRSPESSAQSTQYFAPVELGSISGKIVDQSGVNISGAVVKLAREGEPSTQETTTNGDGLFAFTRIPPGPFQLTVSSAGLRAQEFAATLDSGQAYVTPVIVLVIPTQVTEVVVGQSPQEIAQEQIKEQEKQRVFGIIPNFYVSYVPNAAPLSPKQKFELAWKSASDPITLTGVAVLAGIDQAADRWGAYGQGAEGYSKRLGATYVNVFGATFIGGAIMPSILKQDPRYFYKGKGSTRSRFFYALASSFICKGDNGHWQANYSNIAGSFGGAGLQALYLPANDRKGTGFIFSTALIRLGETSLAGVMQEFILPKFTPNHPTRSHH